MKRRRSIAITAAAIAVGAVLALLMPASPAVGFYSPPLLLDVQLAPTAELVARGAAVEIRVEITCAGANYGAQVEVRVTQRVGSEVASGNVFMEPNCGSQRQTAILLVPAYSDKAFKKGSALAEARIFGCSYNGCGSETDSETISIER